MFRLSRRADYATRVLLELAIAKDQKLTAQEAAKRCGIRLPFLRKAVADLVASGLIFTQPGPGGGMTLARPVSQISMLDVIEALEGSICMNACLLRPDECQRNRTCPAHTFWGRLQMLIVGELRTATLDKLASDYLGLRKHPRSAQDLVAINPYLFTTPRSAKEAGISSSIPRKE
jgi:Rrf2 family protein